MRNTLHSLLRWSERHTRVFPFLQRKRYRNLFRIEPRRPHERIRKRTFRTRDHSSFDMSSEFKWRNSKIYSQKWSKEYFSGAECYQGSSHSFFMNLSKYRLHPRTSLCETMRNTRKHKRTPYTLPFHQSYQYLHPRRWKISERLERKFPDRNRNTKRISKYPRIFRVKKLETLWTLELLSSRIWV